MSQSKVKTLDGRRTPVADLNIEPPRALQASNRGIWAKLAVIHKNLSQVMAGMYTGVGCSGTPNPFHSYEEPSSHDSDRDTPSK